MSSEGTIAKMDEFVTRNSKVRYAVIESVEKFEQNHEKYLRKEYGRFCAQFEAYHGIATTLLHNLNYGENEHIKDYRALQFQVIVNAQKTLYSAYTLFKKGMYDDCVATLRIVYESFLRVVFMSLNQGHPYNAIIRSPSEGPKFNATNLVEDQLKFQWTHYSILSNFAHGNSYRVFLDIDANNDEKNPQPITVRYKIDDDMISISTNYFYFLMLNHIWFITANLRPDEDFLEGNKELKDLYDEADEARDLMFDVLSNHTASEVWRKVAGNLEQLFNLLSRVDEKGSNGWQKEWQGIIGS